MVMHRLKISLLGKLELSIDEEPVEVSSNYVRALLLFLAIEKHHPHRREILAEMFWPVKPDGVARNSLKQAISNLRKALGDRDHADPFLLISRDEIQINQSSPYWIDAVEFSELIESTENHTHGNLTTCNVCENKLLKAVEYYRGEFLKEFYLPDNQEFNDWVTIKREFFRQQMADALQKLVRIFEARREFSLASDFCRQLVALEPWGEQNHRNLMRLLALNGMRSAALRQYQICRDDLQNELGVEPSKTTEALYEEIVNWESSEFPMDDPLSESMERPGQSVLHKVGAIQKVDASRRMASRRVIFTIIFVLVIGISFVYWFSSRKELQNQTLLGARLPPVSSENGDDLSDDLQSSEATYHEQTSTLSPVLSTPGNELQVLIALYENTDGPNWENSDGWLSDRSHCVWYGVTCRGGKIVELVLSHNHLNGSISAELGQLEHLENLDLGNNQLRGHIPPELGNLSRLKHLTLWGNRELSGSIPPAFGNLSNLEDLWLAHWESGGSLLSGEIPPELGNLNKLRSLQISVSLLRGPIPVELCSLVNLVDLYLDSNQLNGPIPPEMGNMTNLQVLDLGGNDFEGPIPPEIGNLSMLTYLAFGGNLVSGDIPAELGNLVRLRYLILDNTGLSGPLPRALMNLNLRELTFFGTEVCEPLDEDFQIWLKNINNLTSNEIVCEL